MPQNPVTDSITDQEMAFAHLILAGTVDDRRAAEAVGLNPDTAADTKAKPCVRAYMLEHRTAVSEKRVDQEAEGPRQPNPGRSEILTRLWELAKLSPEATRGSITGQVKAIAMILAIEGLIPGRGLAPAPQPAFSPQRASAPQAPRPEPPPATAKAAPTPDLDRNRSSVANPYLRPDPRNPLSR